MTREPEGFELHASCAGCQWRTRKFFCDTSATALAAFDHYSFASLYPKGAVLFSEGEGMRGIFVLCHGRVKMSVASGDGKILFLRVADAGEGLGLSSLVGGRNYSATVETIEPSQLRFIRARDFVLWMDEFTEGWECAARQLSDECAINEDLVRALGLPHSAKEKLAHLILNWCSDGGEETTEGTLVPLDMTHEEISERIGTSRETVTRLLKYLSYKKIIFIKGSSMTVANKAALESLISI